MSATVGEVVSWQDDAHGKRKGTIISPALWAGTWWATCHAPQTTDVYGCAMLRECGQKWSLVGDGEQPGPGDRQ